MNYTPILRELRDIINTPKYAEFTRTKEIGCVLYMEEDRLVHSPIVKGTKCSVSLPFLEYPIVGDFHTHPEDSDEMFSWSDVLCFFIYDSKISILGYEGEITYLLRSKLPAYMRKWTNEPLYFKTAMIRKTQKAVIDATQFL